MPKEVFKCAWCGKEVVRWSKNPYGEQIRNHFCDNQCKGAWQRKQREELGFTKEWLYEQYIVKGRDCQDIAKEIGRDYKTVWRWITEYGIETRKRGYGKPELLFQKGHDNGRKGTHLSEETKERIRQARLKDGRVPYLVNGKHWLKQEGVHPGTWKGGITPERQAFYSSDKWKTVEAYVRDRDKNTCQFCGKKQPEDCKRQFDIHHIYPFNKNKHLRANPDNLVVLCRGCHMFVHSSKNVERKFLPVEVTIPDWLKGGKDERENSGNR